MLFFQFRNWTYRTFLSSPSKHDQRVRAIQAQVIQTIFNILYICHNSHRCLNETITKTCVNCQQSNSIIHHVLLPGERESLQASWWEEADVHRQTQLAFIVNYILQQKRVS